MQVTVDTSEVDELARKLKAVGFSDRRFAAGLATALTRTAQQVRQEVRDELPRVFDAPTPYTLNSLFVKGATADKLDARVWFKDDRATGRQGTPATYYLLPHVESGERRLKGFEVALRTFGTLPDGWYTAPGEGATLDVYGNVSRGQLIQILSQLRITLRSGSDRNMGFGASGLAAQRRAGGRFFVIPVGNKGGVQPGVYQREFLGRQITPVIVFVRAPRYSKRFDFDGVARRAVDRSLRPNIDRAMQEQLQRLLAKSAR